MDAQRTGSIQHNIPYLGDVRFGSLADISAPFLANRPPSFSLLLPSGGNLP
jgi:hypothetical protein